MKKRGQVSVFIIIGLIVLLSTLFYIYHKITLDRLYTDVDPKSAHPVQKYIEECVSKAAKDAVVIAGRQGGFIYLPPNIAKPPPNPDHPTVQVSDHEPSA